MARAEAGETDPGPELREALVALAVRALGSAPLSVDPIAAGLGRRRFYRLGFAVGADSERAIARIEFPEDPAARPAGVPAEPPLEPIRSFLERAGLPVPRRYGADPARGIELLEDLGDLTLERVALEGPRQRRRNLYADACALLPRLQALAAPDPPLAAFERRLDDSLFAYKAGQLIQHGLPFALGRPASRAEETVVREAFESIARECAEAPARLSHRDYKAANIHVRPAAPGSEAEELVWIDLQGAFLAPPEYDLVCLLRDLHASLPESEVMEQLETTRTQLPDAPERGDFARRFSLLTLTRVGKDFSRFVYAWRERGDRRYAGFLPRGAAILRSAARETRSFGPRFERLAELLEALPESAALRALAAAPDASTGALPCVP